MSTSKSIDGTPLPTLKTPLDTKENRSVNVAKSMLYQIKKLGITIKDEKFLLSFTKSLNEVERELSASYLCFDCDPQRTAQFLQRFQINLSECGQNFSLSKLGYLLALTLGFDKYDRLLKQLDMYQSFIKKPWNLSGKRIIKPYITSIRKSIYIYMPIKSAAPSPNDLYSELHMSRSKIMDDQPGVTGFSIFFSYSHQYRGSVFRTFAITQKDAMAWLIVNALLHKNIILWNAELQYHRALERYEVEQIKMK